MLDLRRLVALREVAIKGTVTEAARSLRFTPSAVSQQIALLERQAGVALVERHGRGIRLTDAAWSLVRRCDVIVAELARAEADLDAAKQSRTGSLVIGAFPTSGTSLVPTALHRFVARRPDVAIRLRELEPERSLPMLRAGELDLAICFECDLVPLADDGYEQETLFVEPMLLVHSPLRGDWKEPVDVASLRDERWIAPASDTAIHKLTVRACQHAGFEPEITSIWTDFQVVQSLAGQGFGVALVPELALDPPRTDAVQKRTSPQRTRRVFAAWRPGTARAPLVETMIEDVRAAAADLRSPTFASTSGSGGP
jgi:DNA-binding transcriptional LysR family regulator